MEEYTQQHLYCTTLGYNKEPTLSVCDPYSYQECEGRVKTGRRRACSHPCTVEWYVSEKNWRN